MNVGTEYSVDELREMAKRGDSFRAGHTRGDVAAAYADLLGRIKTDEGAVAKVIAGEWSVRVCWLVNGKDIPPVGALLFTHPPAQAAQVDVLKGLKASPDHQTDMLIARAVVSGVVVPDAPAVEPMELADIVKLIVNTYPVAAIVREMDVQAPGIRGAFAPLAPTAEPVAQSEAGQTTHEAKALGRCCADLERFVSMASDYELDEMAVQSLRTAIDCMRDRAAQQRALPDRMGEVSFATVEKVVKTLCRIGHAFPEGQEEQAARFESLVLDLCRSVQSHFDTPTAQPAERVVEVMTVKVSGYLPKQRAVEIRFDGPLPAWVCVPGASVVITAAQQADR